VGKTFDRSQAYCRINTHMSAGETPALKLADGTVLSESTGIARYLDNVHPGRKIMGENPLEQG